MQEITTLAQFSTLKNKPLLIIDFYADWCGPCKAISPVFERLAEKHKASSTTVVFAKVNVDVARDVSSQCGISAMPTFQFWSGGTKKDEIRGADPSGLTRKIESFVASAVKSSLTSGTKLGGAGSESRGTFQGSTPVSSGQEGSLRSLIDVEKSHVLNATPTSSIKTLLRPSFAGATVDSLNGPKILLYIALTQPVNVKSIKVSVPIKYRESAPSRIHIGTNVAASAAYDMLALARAETVQSFTIYSDDYSSSSGTTELSLKQNKFKNVTSVTVMVDANVSDGQVTRLSQVELFGSKA